MGLKVNDIVNIKRVGILGMDKAINSLQKILPENKVEKERCDFWQLLV